MATTTWPAEVYVFDGTHWVSISPHGMTSLPPATGTALGGVIVGSGVNVAHDGTISVTHFSGDYNDLINKPIVAAPVQSDWNSAGGDSYILNKPVALSQFSNDLKISDFPNDALYTTVPQAAAAAPIQTIVAGANVAISNDGHGNITIASTGTGSGPGGGIASVSGSAPIKVVDGTTAPVISLNVGAGLKVNSGALEADVPDASTTTKGIVQIADAASITAGTALRAVDAAGLKAVTDQQTKDFVNVSGDTMTGALVIPDGTAAAPSLKFNDATGLFQPAANAWAVSAGGVERLRVASDGAVEVRNSTTPTLTLYNTNVNIAAGGTLGSLGFYSSDASTNATGLRAFVRAVENDVGGFGRSYDLTFGTGDAADATEKLRVTKDGKVGIGRTVPASALDVNGVITVSAGTAVAPALVASGDSDTGLWFPAANTVALSTAGVERLRVSPDGGVGLGVAASNSQCFSIRNSTAVTSGTHLGIVLMPSFAAGASTIVNCWSQPAIKANVHDIYHYRVFPHTGSGTVSNEIGFLVSSNFTVANKNYGYRSQVPLDAGKENWNFYSEGAAPNYFKGQVQVERGTFAEPPLSFSGDTDTGVMSPASDSISLCTAGLERLRVIPNGNVGIGPGETNPASPLSVRGVVASQAMRRHSSVANYQIFSGVSDTSIAVYRDEGGMAIGLGNTGAPTHTLSLQSNVKRSGNSDVGVFHKQDLTGSALISYGLWHQASYTDIAATQHYSFYDASQSLNKSTLTTLVSFRAAPSSAGVTNQRGFESVINVGTAGTTRHAIYASGSAPSFFAGNVGIGDANPSSKLVVNGDVAVADKIIHYGDPNTAIRFPSLDTFAVETGGTERLRVKSTGGVKYVPLATAPATPEQGEVYFDSTTKKLRVYDGTAWADLH
jgi:hypothetical protein